VFVGLTKEEYLDLTPDEYEAHCEAAERKMRMILDTLRAR
jgi:hypothetical protein